MGQAGVTGAVDAVGIGVELGAAATATGVDMSPLSASRMRDGGVELSRTGRGAFWEG